MRGVAYRVFEYLFAQVVREEKKARAQRLLRRLTRAVLAYSGWRQGQVSVQGQLRRDLHGVWL